MKYIYCVLTAFEFLLSGAKNRDFYLNGQFITWDVMQQDIF